MAVTETEILAIGAAEPAGPNTSWGAIIAGAVGAVAVSLILMLVGSWLPSHWFPMSQEINHSPGWFFPVPLDKLIHGLMFAGFAFLWGYRPGKPLRTNIPLLGGLAFIVLTEWGQSTAFVGRTADLGDALADLVGLLFGLLVTRLVSPESRREVAEVL